MKRNLIALFLIFSMILVGCSSNENESAANKTETQNGEYILTSKNGIVTMYDNVSNVITEIDLGGGENSDYIYAEDNGNIYTSKMKDGIVLPKVIYGLDKNSKKLSIITAQNNELRIVREIILKDSNIEAIAGYNGLIFYSTKNQETKASSHTYIRPQSLSDEGKLSYSKSIPVNEAKDSVYVYMENLFEDYLTFTGLSEFVSEVDKHMMNMPTKERDVFELPGDINTWTVNNQNVYFFSNSMMGQYNVSSNQITLHYGPIRPIKATYIDGIDKSLYAISDFGENSSKGILMNIDYDKMIVNKTIDIQYPDILAIHVDKKSNIYLLFKNNSSDKNFSQLRVFKYEDYSEEYTIGVPYLPTKVISKNDTVYLFNPFESYFMVGSVGSSEFTKVEKTTKDIKYIDLFLINEEYRNDYFYNENGLPVNKNNVLINSNGELINEYNDRVNRYGQRIDENGKAINKDGEFIDRYNNILDKSGNIVKYIPDTDGNYYNSKGDFVSENGTLLVRNEIGDWVLPEELIEEQGGVVITGHYDENGNFIIDKEVLEKHPDAYEIWQKQKNEK